jgi:hypothetical protein
LSWSSLMVSDAFSPILSHTLCLCEPNFFQALKHYRYLLLLQTLLCKSSLSCFFISQRTYQASFSHVPCLDHAQCPQVLVTMSRFLIWLTGSTTTHGLTIQVHTLKAFKPNMVFFSIFVLTHLILGEHGHIVMFVIFITVG